MNIVIDLTCDETIIPKEDDKEIMHKKHVREFREYLNQNVSDADFKDNANSYIHQIIRFFYKSYSGSLNIMCIWNSKMTSVAGKFIDDDSGPVIELSKSIVINWHTLKETLIHELCHAGTLLVSQDTVYHGSTFKWWAKMCYDDLGIKITTCHEFHINHKYTFKCNSCGKTFKKNKMLKSKHTVCGCGHKLEKTINH